MAKTFLSFDQQLDKLTTEKGLIINDKAYAELELKRIGYFALISGYKHLFKNTTTKKFKDNVTFEEIVALYKLDERLRELFFKYILQVERNIRSLISYYFTCKYGELQTYYLDKNNYNYSSNNKLGINRLVTCLDKMVTAERSDYAYIHHHKTVHGNIPLWVLINAVTLGTLSKMYQFSRQDIQAKISKNFNHINEKELKQLLSVITKYRNVCAHGERLFNYKTTDTIPDMILHQKLGIAKKNAQYICGKRDLFAIVIALRYLLPKEEFKEFKKQLVILIKKALRSCVHIDESVLLAAMGFPANWCKIMVYSNK